MSAPPPRLAAWLLALLLCGGAAAADVEVPAELQVALLRKVVRFERGFVERAGAAVVLLLVVRAGSERSERAAAQLGKALEDVRDLAGRPLRVDVVRYETPAALRAAALGGRAALVCLTPGLDGEVGAIAGALDGVPAITVGADGADVDRGAVLGFELVSARPKIVINVGQARRQGLDWNSELFRLARVVK